MDLIYRIIDVNINRASEGIRVLEDLARFYYNNPNMTAELRTMRHEIRKSVTAIVPKCINNRDSINDIGLNVSRLSKLDNKKSINELIRGNFKRLQESLRVIEETLKIIDLYDAAKIYEEIRFNAYNLEKIFVKSLNNTDENEIWQYQQRKKLLKSFTNEIYCITAEEYSNNRDNIDVVKEMLEAGIKIIQYREKDKKTSDMIDECKKIRKLTFDYKAIFIVNDDINIAKIVKADGVHIGQDDLPIEYVRNFLGPDFIIGLSTHSAEQCNEAITRGVDYIGVGPIFKTNTKKDVCNPVGLEYLDYVTKNTDIPFVAIGGIKEHNIDDVLAKKPKMIALVTEIVGAKNIKEKIGALKKKIVQNY